MGTEVYEASMSGELLSTLAAVGRELAAGPAVDGHLVQVVAWYDGDGALMRITSSEEPSDFRYWLGDLAASGFDPDAPAHSTVKVVARRHDDDVAVFAIDSRLAQVYIFQGSGVPSRMSFLEVTDRPRVWRLIAVMTALAPLAPWENYLWSFLPYELFEGIVDELG